MDSDVEYYSDEIDQESTRTKLKSASKKKVAQQVAEPRIQKNSMQKNSRKRKHSSSSEEDEEDFTDDGGSDFTDGDDSGIIDEDIDIFKDGKPPAKKAKEDKPEEFDPILQSRQWLELQKRRKKIKKIVDTRASKGRKIRYVTISKLVNFHPAVPETIKWSHERRNELFKSLFK